MVIDQKQLESMEYFSCLHSMINGARCMCETKSRIAMAETAFNKKKTLFTLDLIYGRNKLPYLEYSFVWC